ncbi:carbohydrate ABC transporter permease [Anaerobium acetethylicum]|uniref:Putative aldouronate transport system permease protein n=1 Tax=Anaerobium acetethylicum TaxID=1619234 RepID=A0A1D3TT05_9FIRM|nr:carbohydrate ABC transporter permease [Anaerobium acetethylicum]SCP96982.1 putative aldouronate transport system permease protein [Anaerobium acetethylicum]
MKTREDKIYDTIGHVIMTILSLVAIIPILLMLVSSATDNNALLQNGYSFFPEKWSLFAYEWIFSSNSAVVLRAYGMSFVLTGSGVTISLIITTLLAYGLSKKDLPFRGALTFMVFFTMLFNGGLVSTYINYTRVFHVKDTFAGLLVPGLLMNAFNVLLMKSYFVTGVPDEILEAAYIDGAGEFQTMYAVALPMAKPIIATIGMFVGISYWNDWNNGFIYLVKNTDLYSIQNLLNRLMQNIQALSQNASNLSDASQGLAQIPTATVRMAMATLGILPIVIIYPFIQKNFVKGITLGGVKG